MSRYDNYVMSCNAMWCYDMRCDACKAMWCYKMRRDTIRCMYCIQDTILFLFLSSILFNCYFLGEVSYTVTLVNPRWNKGDVCMRCNAMRPDLNRCLPKWKGLTIWFVHESLSTYLSTNEDKYLSATRLILFWRWLNLTSKNCACRSSSVSLSVVLGLLDMTSRNTEKTLSPTADIHCQIPEMSQKLQSNTFNVYTQNVWLLDLFVLA